MQQHSATELLTTDTSSPLSSDPLPNCVICGKACRYKHFCNERIDSCEGCKPFFRRAARNEKYWRCKGGKRQCEESKRCKGCRFDRCLRAGMDWRNLISPMEKEHIAKLKLHQILVNAKSTMESNELQTLLRVVDAQCRIMHAFADFNDYQASTFGSTMDHVLSHSENILGLAQHFSVDPRPLSEAIRAKLCAEAETLGFMHPIIAKLIQVDMLLCVGIIKVMPVFGRLATADKVNILCCGEGQFDAADSTPLVRRCRFDAK